MHPFLQNLALLSGDAKITLSESILLPSGKRLDSGLQLSRLHLSELDDGYRAYEIESLVVIADTFSADTLSHDLQRFCRSNLSMTELYRPDEHNYWLALGAQVFVDYPKLHLRLYMLKRLLPEVYEQTLFCLWFTVFDSHRAQRSSEAFCEFYVAALVHDLGLLDVELCSSQAFGAESGEGEFFDREATHTKFGADYAKRTVNASENIVKAVLQHHERIDGTGRPVGLAGRQLSELGMFLHLFDSVYLLYCKYFRSSGKPLAELLPIIEINAVTRFGNVAFNMIEMLRPCSLSSTTFFGAHQVQAIQKQILMMSQLLDQTITAVQSFTQKVGFRHEDKRVFSLQNSFIHIALVHHKLQEDREKRRLLETEDLTSEAEKALESQYFSLKEITAHIEQFCWRLNEYSDAHRGTETADLARDLRRHIVSLTASSNEALPNPEQ
jgi:hypothetical protein